MQLNNLPDHILRIHLQFTTFRLAYGVPYIQVSKFISRAIQPTLICLILHSICRNVDPPCKMSLLVIRFPNLSSQLCIILFDVWLSWLFIVLSFTFYLGLSGISSFIWSSRLLHIFLHSYLALFIYPREWGMRRKQLCKAAIAMGDLFHIALLTQVWNQRFILSSLHF